jgi:GNAT superfamily N-acetyltransferase
LAREFGTTSEPRRSAVWRDLVWGLTLIRYTDSLEGISATQLIGFFVDWPNSPSTETHLRLLKGSDRIVLAIDEDRVVGFVTAITDGVLSAYIPLLEVLPSHRSRGIGSELVKRILGQLDSLYMVDLVCDEELIPFYERFGMVPGHGMIRRSYSAQAGGVTPNRSN